MVHPVPHDDVRPAAKHRPALKLVKTLDLGRDQWRGRKRGIGSSDAAAAVGLSFQSQLALWLQKTGRDTAPASGPLDTSASDCIQEDLQPHVLGFSAGAHRCGTLHARVTVCGIINAATMGSSRAPVHGAEIF